MKFWILLLAVSVTIFQSCDAACQYALPVDGQIGCSYRDQVLELGTHKRIGCENCTCEHSGTLRCCSIGGYITNHPPECKVKQIGCYQKAYLISDPTVECTHGITMIG